MLYPGSIISKFVDTELWGPQPPGQAGPVTLFTQSNETHTPVRWDRSLDAIAIYKILLKKPRKEQMKSFDVIGYRFIFTKNKIFLPISRVLFS